jgi:hypothetical protein
VAKAIREKMLDIYAGKMTVEVVMCLGSACRKATDCPDCIRNEMIEECISSDHA